MKRILIFLLLLSILLSGCGGSAADAPTETELFAMDTFMRIRIWGGSDLLDDACAEIRRLESLFSVTSDESELYALNRDGTAALSEDTAALLRLASQAAERTDGDFDPTVGPLVRLWGFLSDEPHVATQAEIDALLPLVGAEHLRLTDSTATLADGCAVDLGGIAKGYTAQKCLSLLKAGGASAAIVSLGGNVQTLGSKPDGENWVIGIADPAQPSEAIATLTFSGAKALVTSGSYQRCFTQDGRQYHHILDPATGRPAESGLTSVTVLAEDGALADALSTALFVKGLDESVAFWRESDDFEAIFLTEDGNILATEGAAPLLGNCEFQVISR